MAKLSPKMWYLLKYGFLALIIAGIMVTILPVSKPGDGFDVTDLLDENFSEPYVESSVETLGAIRQDVQVCLLNLSQDKKSLILNGSTISELQSSIDQSKEYFMLLANFNNLLSSVDIKGAIIEPSILYCMVNPYYQEVLLKRNLNINNISGSKSVVTFGIFGQDVAILLQEHSIDKFRKAGFLPYFVVSPVADWMLREPNFEMDTFVSHIFYNSTSYTVHVVVFYERGNYLWHAALDSKSRQEIPQKDELLFVDYNGAYEKFTLYSLESEVLPLSNFYIPSTSHYFLLETLSSRFLECNASRAVNDDSYSNHPKSHSGMSVERFKLRTHIVLHQLKSIFHPMLMNLWIWSGTMLGWHRECDIIPYTTDVDFAAWASELENPDRIINLLLNNKHVKIKERMGMLEEGLEFNIHCYGLRTDVFFLYHIENGSWCSGHSPKLGYYFRYYYPNFTLCSADLLGEKVQVPCETEQVILTEYGSGWNKPVSNWHYETSIRNRGPNKYWDKKKLKHAYSFYN